MQKQPLRGIMASRVISQSQDSIVVLGGPGSGKTVYLSVLYHHLWQGHDEVYMRAADGRMHDELLANFKSIVNGVFPPATQTLRRFEFELEFKGRAYYITFLDYPGELFTRVFHNLVLDSDEARTLNHVFRRAAGIIFLIDPMEFFITKDGPDLQYTLTSALRSATSQTRHRRPPRMVVVLTKRDLNHFLVDEKGGAVSFVARRLPKVGQMIRGLHVLHLSSIQQDTQRGYTPSQPATCLRPIKVILNELQGIQTAIELQRIHSTRHTAGVILSILLLLGVSILSFVLGLYAGR